MLFSQHLSDLHVKSIATLQPASKHQTVTFSLTDEGKVIDTLHLACLTRRTSTDTVPLKQL